MRVFVVLAVCALVSVVTSSNVREKRGFLPAQNNGGLAAGYYAPSISYAAPTLSYSAPAVSYSAPSVSYAAPALSYSAPAVHYSAPTTRVIAVNKVVNVQREVTSPQVVYVRKLVTEPRVITVKKLVPVATNPAPLSAGLSGGYSSLYFGANAAAAQYANGW